MRLLPSPTKRSRPALARSTIRGSSWLSPGPQISRGRSATVARSGPLAASTAFSAMVLVVAYGALKPLP